MSSSYKPADSKREEFRKYLEKTGVLDALTKTLVTLYEENEKPNEALDFLKKTFSYEPTQDDTEMLKTEIQSLKSQLEKCKNENNQLKEKLSKLDMKTEK